MPNFEEHHGPLKRIGPVVAIISGIVAIIVGIVTVAVEWHGDEAFVSTIFLAIGLAIAAFVWLYLVINLGIITFSHNKPLPGLSRVSHFPHSRLWALVGLLVFILVPAGIFGINRYEKWQEHVRRRATMEATCPSQATLSVAHYEKSPSPSNSKFIVRVANFAGPDPKAYGIADNVQERLSRALAKFPDTQLERTHQTFDTSAEARKAGEKAEASILIWGSYHIPPKSKEVELSVHFEVFNPPPDLPDLGSVVTNGDFTTFSIADLNSFSLQMDLSEEMTYLTLFVSGLVHLEKGDPAEAIKRFCQALEQKEEPVPTVGKGTVYFYLGLTYFDQGQPDKVITDFTQVLRLDPKAVYAYTNRGFAYVDQGQLGKAIADFTRAQRINPQFYGAYNGRSTAYLEQGRLDKAMADITRALQINPKDAYAYNNRGIVYAVQGKLDKAIADYTHALKLNPKDADAYANRGTSYFKQGQFDKAIIDLTQALQLGLKDASIYTYRGLAYTSQGQLDKALADFNHVLQLNPKDTSAYLSCGTIYLVQGQLDKAITNFNHALQLDPKIVYAYFGRGRAYRDQGQLDKAIADYTHVLQLDPKDADAYFNRGKAYAAQGKRTQALTDLHKALELNPTPDLRKSVEGLIDELN